MKELTLSSDIGAGDLNTKLRQISAWLDKKHHVRVTLRRRHYGGVDDIQPLVSTLILRLGNT